MLRQKESYSHSGNGLIAGKGTEATRLMQDQVEPYYKSEERLLTVLIDHNIYIAENLDKENEKSAECKSSNCFCRSDFPSLPIFTECIV